MNFEAFYRDHFDAITNLAITEFDLAPQQAEDLAHDVFIAAIKHIDTIANPRTWLVAAITGAARQATKDRR